MRNKISVALLALSILTSGALAFAQQEKVIYRFTGNSDGFTPMTGLVTDSTGNLYGSTYTGSTAGTAFELTPPTVAGEQWTESTLHTFGGTNDGAGEISVLTFDTFGNLYGATAWGGTSSQGTVFQLVPPATAGGAWTENVLHRFAGGSDSSDPYGGVVIDKSGNLFGTTSGNPDSPTYGTVYELSPPSVVGGAWTENILYTFKGTTDGCGPNGKLVFGSNGALYGTAVQCGGTQRTCSFGCGTIFEVVPPALAGGKWTERTIYQFQGKSDGEWPANGLVADGKGNLYGATQWGGTCPSGAPGCGTVFEISPPSTAGGKWTEAVLYSFQGSTDGEDPEGGVIIDQAGSLFGTTNFSGDLSCDTGSGCGTVFELSPPSAGGAWTLSTLHSFTGVPDGASTGAGLTTYKGKETLYGVTSSGGECKSNSVGCGTVFAVLP